MKNLLSLALLAVLFGCSSEEKKDEKKKDYKKEAKEMAHGEEAPIQSTHNTEEYDYIDENEFLEVTANPLSTFSVDVDAASYSNVRRFITDGMLPPKDAVRIEEMINYFSYDYKNPKDQKPFSIHTELGECPWNKQHKLLHIGLKGKELEKGNIPPSNLVFLLDVSGSMEDPDKLPLLQNSFNLLVNQLGDRDNVAIVVYAGAAGLVLPSTSCDQKDVILQAINNLRAGGSTAGGEGIHLAYKVATENFKENGNNRVILATDGDFNVGQSSDAELERMIEEKRESGVYLSVLGFGTGNLKDSKMEKIADKGNGNYYYIDNIFEARKVLVTEMGATLNTIAKDVKIQVEFNPAKVYRYRLIGYENRMMSSEDFDDDTKDAGEIGAGHTVTALYEIELVGPSIKDKTGKQYKYQSTQINKEAYSSNEVASLKFRYKEPEDTVSQLIEKTVNAKYLSLAKTSINFRFSAAVAEFGLLLRDSKHKGESTYEQVVEMALSAKGEDEEGYRSEFVKMVRLAKDLE